MPIKNTKENPLFAEPIPEIEQRLAEAARYALIRRIAPSIRHNLAGNIQPVAMTAALLKRRLQKPETDRAVLEKAAADIAVLARESATAAIESMAWFAPLPQTPVALAQGIGECLQLLSTPLSFQGFEIDRQTLDEVSDVSGSLVLRDSLRMVFSSALLAITDSAAVAGLAGTLVIGLEHRVNHVCVHIELKITQVAPAREIPHIFRHLRCEDAAVLAAVENVQLQWLGLPAQDDPNLPFASPSLIPQGVLLEFARVLPDTA